MFEAKIAKASLLKKIIEAIKELISEAKFECTPSGMTLQAMDAAHVSLVALLLRADAFEEYRCDRNISLGINLEIMAKVLKGAANDDCVTLRAEDDGDTVTFIFESKNKITHFEMKLLDIDSDTLGIPDVEYKSVIKMPSAEFQKTCSHLSIWGDSVTISSSKDGIKFSVDGEQGNCKMDFKQDSDTDDGVVLEVSDKLTLSFALKKLCAFTKASSLSATVRLSMSDDVPLAVEYKCEEMGYIRYFLAPKIDEDA
uniref:DNA sliding clamp PCNA n=1 Tax=Arcella intermedia TaxID=1963864 RepID=A0A6B2LEY1_9EUKA